MVILESFAEYSKRVKRVLRQGDYVFLSVVVELSFTEEIRHLKAAKSHSFGCLYTYRLQFRL